MWSHNWVEIGEPSASCSVRRTRRRRRPPSPVVDPCFPRSLPVYADCGNAVHVCAFCQAESWYGERVLRLARRGAPMLAKMGMIDDFESSLQVLRGFATDITV